MRVPTTYHLLFVHTGEAFLTRGAQRARPAARIGAGSVVLLRPQDLSHERTVGRRPSRQTWVAVVPDALSAEQLALLDVSPEVLPQSAALRLVQRAIVDTAWGLDAHADVNHLSIEFYWNVFPAGGKRDCDTRFENSFESVSVRVEELGEGERRFEGIIPGAAEDQLF